MPLSKRRLSVKPLSMFFLVVLLISIFAQSAFAIKYISGYTRRDGTYVSGHYRDTSNDGYEYNNADYLGYNDYWFFLCQLKAYIVQTFTCHQCKETFDLSIAQILNSYLSGKAGDVICPFCHFAKGLNISGFDSVFGLPVSEAAKVLLSIEKELNSLLSQRLSENGFFNIEASWKLRKIYWEEH